MEPVFSRPSQSDYTQLSGLVVEGPPWDLEIVGFNFCLSCTKDYKRMSWGLYSGRLDHPVVPERSANG